MLLGSQSENQSTKMSLKFSQAVKIILFILFAVNFINSLEDHKIFGELALDQGLCWVCIFATVEEGEPFPLNVGRGKKLNISFFTSRLQLELS